MRQAERAGKMLIILALNICGICHTSSILKQRADKLKASSRTDAKLAVRIIISKFNIKYTCYFDIYNYS